MGFSYPRILFHRKTGGRLYSLYILHPIIFLLFFNPAGRCWLRGVKITGRYFFIQPETQFEIGIHLGLQSLHELLNWWNLVVLPEGLKKGVYGRGVFVGLGKDQTIPPKFQIVEEE